MEQPDPGNVGATAPARKVNLTDRFIRSLEPAAAGKRVDFADAVVPGLVLRVTDRGHKSFVLRCRYPAHPANPTRRALGDCYVPKNGSAPAALSHGALTLAEARDKARLWLDMIARGIDPKIEEMRERAAIQRRHGTTFAAVAAEFLDRHASKLAKRVEAERIIKGEFVKRWGPRPIAEIMPGEVAAVIRAIAKGRRKQGAPYQAHNALAYLRRLFNWSIGTNEFGIDRSPVERIKPVDLIGKREARERVLTDAELRAVWQAADAMGYPYGPVFRMLILTGQREREVADMSWSEIDLEQKLWTIPARRMKGGRAHEVPLSPAAVSLLESLPRWTGDFVFTTTAGAKPINGFSKAKARIDRLSAVSGWKIHDLRRTMRTHLSALPVQDLVRELVIAHARPGLHAVYDRHSYESEKRHCLALWENRLLRIVEPAPPNVADLEQQRAARAREIA
jgi:integrase